MKENLLEGTKGAIKKVGGAVGKLLKPAEGIFSSILKFLTMFLLGTGLMKLLDWMGDSENQKKDGFYIQVPERLLACHCHCTHGIRFQVSLFLLV